MTGVWETVPRLRSSNSNPVLTAMSLTPSDWLVILSANNHVLHRTMLHTWQGCGSLVVENI